MKRFHQWLIGISLIGMLASGIASASFSGGGGGLSITEIITGITGIFAKLDATNTFVKDQKINDADVLAGGAYSGVRLQTTERASFCLGPSDGQSKEFCLSGGGLLQLHGSNGSLYDGTVTGNQVLASDPGLNRHWFAPTGNAVFVGGTGTPETSFMVGSHLRNAATFLADTTNDWTKHLPISAPAAGECDSADEKGRMYFDSTANAFKYCNGTAWDGFADGNTTTFTGLTDTPANYTSAAGKALKVNAAANAVEFVSVGNVAVENYHYAFDASNDQQPFYTGTTISLGWDAPGNDIELTRTVAPSSGDVSAVCQKWGTFTASAYQETDINSGSATDIFSAGLPSCERMECTISSEEDATYPTFNLIVHHTCDGLGTSANAVVQLKVLRP